MKKIILFHFMLSAFTYGWDGTKYQYYRYIQHLLIDKQLVGMVCLFWDGLRRRGGGLTNYFANFAREKKFREHNFYLKKNFIFIGHKFFIEGKFCHGEQTRMPRRAEPLVPWLHCWWRVLILVCYGVHYKLYRPISQY